MISLSIGKTYKSLVEKKFHPDDEIILKPSASFVSTEPFIKKERNGRKNSTKRLALYRIVCEDGIYKEKKPDVPLPLNYTEEDRAKAQTKLLCKVSNDKRYITEPLKIKVKDLIKIPNSQLKKFWRYSVPLPEINNPSQITENQKILAYYIGYWLGDGTSASPGALTIGKDDQPEIIPELKKLAQDFDLILTMARNKKRLTCTLNKGHAGRGKKKDASYLQEDWVPNITAACEELEISINTIDYYKNFQNNYDPRKQYKKGNDYYCECNKFNTEHITKKRKSEGNIKKNRFAQHLKQVHSIDTPFSNKVWSLKTDEEQLKYKLPQINKEEIIEKYRVLVKNLNGVTFCRYYKIWEKDKINGLQNFVNEYKASISPILLEFHKLNLINNKHIPEIYFTAPLEVRKQLLAGLIDSDGGKDNPDSNCWSFSQSLEHKRIIDDVERLAQSLGMFVRRTGRDGSNYSYKGKKSPKPSIRLTITPYNNFDIPLIYKRKRLTRDATQLPIVTHKYPTEEIIKPVKVYPIYITHYEEKGFSIGNEFTRKWSISSKYIDHDIKLDFAIKIANCLDSKGVIEGKEDEIENTSKDWKQLLYKKQQSINRKNRGTNLIKNDTILGFQIKRKINNKFKFKTFKFKGSGLKFDHSKKECKTIEECKKMCYLWYDSFDSEENKNKYEEEYKKLKS